MGMHALIESYPEVPESIIIKIEALRLGVNPTPAAVDAFGRLDTVFKGYFLFSQDVSTPATAGEKIPSDFILKSDDTVIQLRRNHASPYSIDVRDGAFMLYDGQEPLGEITFRKRPRYYYEELENGKPMASIVQSVGVDKLFVTFNKYCEFWKADEECLFCDFTAHTVFQKKSGEKLDVHKDPELVAEVLSLALKETGYRHIALSAGTILSTYQGQQEVDHYVTYLEAIRRRLKVWYPSYFQIVAHREEEARKLFATGVGTLHHNTEVWDERIWNVMCPGKARAIGYQEWVRRMVRSAKIFGEGRIVSTFVAGSEMARPFGFTDVDEAVTSTLGGFDYLMGNGIIPRMDVWVIEANTRLAGQPPTPFEYYLKMARGYYELRRKHNLPVPACYCRGCNVNDVMCDWEYYEQLRGREAKAAVA
ncbi:MAG: hypothetical protein HYY96_12410 [Candidatus Tectomicrobia bacterium]|nr:hypothetical protein [Candidatus Tectomicrobia bacterium]